MSSILLDQEAKHLLYSKQGCGQSPLLKLKFLPIFNSECFFTLNKHQLTVWQNHNALWTYKVLTLEDEAFSFDID